MDTIKIEEVAVAVNGRDYYVNSAEVSVEVEAVGYDFNPRAFVGRDVMGQVPQAILSMEVVNNHSEDETVKLEDVEGIREAILKAAREECREVGYGRWM